MADQQLPDRKETGEMANPKRTQVSDEGQTLREKPPATGQGADWRGDRHEQDWRAAAGEVREAADEAGRK